VNRVANDVFTSTAQREGISPFLLRIIPEAFVFEDQGKEGESAKIAFHPNPEFKPKTYEQRILHALDGILFIDLRVASHGCHS